MNLTPIFSLLNLNTPKETSLILEKTSQYMSLESLLRFDCLSKTHRDLSKSMWRDLRKENYQYNWMMCENGSYHDKWNYCLSRITNILLLELFEESKRRSYSRSSKTTRSNPQQFELTDYAMKSGGNLKDRIQGVMARFPVLGSYFKAEILEKNPFSEFYQTELQCHREAVHAAARLGYSGESLLDGLFALKDYIESPTDQTLQQLTEKGGEAIRLGAVLLAEYIILRTRDIKLNKSELSLHQYIGLEAGAKANWEPLDLVAYKFSEDWLQKYENYDYPPILFALGFVIRSHIKEKKFSIGKLNELKARVLHIYSTAISLYKSPLPTKHIIEAAQAFFEIGQYPLAEKYYDKIIHLVGPGKIHPSILLRAGLVKKALKKNYEAKCLFMWCPDDIDEIDD